MRVVPDGAEVPGRERARSPLRLKSLPPVFSDCGRVLQGLDSPDTYWRLRGVRGEQATSVFETPTI